MPEIKQDIRGITFVVAANDSLHKNMADYVCDGIDDHIEIQAAIDALPADGGRVVLLEGTYILNGWAGDLGLILTRAHVTLEGQGWNTILKVADGLDAGTRAVIGGVWGVPNYARVANLKIDGNKDNCDVGSLHPGIKFAGNYVIVENCWVYKPVTHGIELPGNYNIIRNNLVEDTFDGAIGEVHGTGCLVEGNIVKGGTEGIILGEGSHNTVVGNFISSTSKGVVFHKNCSHNLVANNTINLGGGDGGIWVQGTWGDAGYVLSYNQIIGNHVTGAVRGIIIEAAGTNSTYSNSIVGNRVQLCTQHGIAIINSNDNLISDNYCMENSQATNNTYDNIYLEDADYNHIHGNTCRRGAQANKPHYGINISNAGCSHNVVRDNDLYDAGSTANLNDAGTYTLVEENRGFAAGDEGCVTFVVAASNSIQPANADYVCDGTADDVEINAALAAAAGGKVVLLEGNYQITANLVVPAGTHLSGMGKGTILTTTDAVAIINMVIVNGNNVTISDMKLVLGAGAGDAGTRPNVVYASSKTLVWLENLWIVGDLSVDYDGSETRQNGVFFTSVTDSKIISCRIEDNKCHGANLTGSTLNLVSQNTVQGNGREGIILSSGANNNTVTSNTCHGNSRSGILLYGSSENTIVGNNCSTNSRSGIACESGSNNNAVTGNVCESNGLSGITINGADENVVTGNQCEDNGSHGIEVLRGDYCTITGNGCHNNTGDGINVTGDGSGNADYNTLTGNVCHGNAGDGIEIVGGVNVNKNIVVGNQLTSNTGTAFVDNGTNTNAWHQHSDLFMDVLAASTTHLLNAQDVSAYTGGETPAIAAQPDVPRNITVTAVDAAAGPPVLTMTIIITGIDAKGNTVSETFETSGSETKVGNVAFATVTSQEVDVIAGNGVGDTLSIGIGSKLGLSNIIYATGDVYKCTKNGADYSGAGNITPNATYDTVDVSTGAAIVGGADFRIMFRSNLNIVS